MQRQAMVKSKSVHQRKNNPQAVNTSAPVYPSLSAMIQRVQDRPESLEQGEIMQLQKAIGYGQTKALLNGQTQSYKPTFRGFSQGLSSDPIQTKERELENKTGLPDNLKTGIENLSGYSLDDVRVHYNSDKPAQLQALAYTQGTDIHVAPGQEEHLPHEAWHVVQQMQGRVKPTMQMRVEQINEDEGLEREADVMGEKASRGIDNVPIRVDPAKVTHHDAEKWQGKGKKRNQHEFAIFPSQVELQSVRPEGAGVTQRVISDEDLPDYAELDEEEWHGLTDEEKTQVREYKRELAASRERESAWSDALASRVKCINCVSWVYDRKQYHINLKLGTYHVTEEDKEKIHYYFKGIGMEGFLDAQPETSERASDPNTQKKFSELPPEVQTFIKAKWKDLLL